MLNANLLHYLQTVKFLYFPEAMFLSCEKVKDEQKFENSIRRRQPAILPASQTKSKACYLFYLAIMQIAFSHVHAKANTNVKTWNAEHKFLLNNVLPIFLKHGLHQRRINRKRTKKSTKKKTVTDNYLCQNCRRRFLFPSLSCKARQTKWMLYFSLYPRVSSCIQIICINRSQNNAAPCSV